MIHPYLDKATLINQAGTKMRNVNKRFNTRGILAWLLLISIAISVYFTYHLRSQNNVLAISFILCTLLLALFVLFLVWKGLIKANKGIENIQGWKNNFQLTLNSLGEGLISTNNRGQIRYMNLVAEKYTGWSLREAKNLPLEKVYSVSNEETGVPFENVVRRVLNSGEAVGLENNTILKSKKGDSLIISNSASPIFDLNGRMTGTVLIFNDITPKKVIEKALKESEEKYRNIIHYASDAILIYSFDGVIYEFNRACHTQLGYTREEFSSLSLFDILPGEMEITKENFDHISAGGSITIYKFLKRKDGSLIEVEASLKLLSDGRIIGFARDVTERRKTENELIKINTRLEHAEEQANMGCWEWDLILDKRYLSKTLLRLFGLNQADNQPSIEQYLNCIHPEDREENHKRLLQIAKGANDLPPYVYRTNPENGPVRILQSSLYNIRDENGTIIKFGGTIQDITERKKAEASIIEAAEKYRSLVEQAAEGILLFDQKGNICSCNSSACRMAGYSLEEMLKLNIMDIIPDEFALKLPVNIEKVKEGKAIMLDRLIRRKDGSIFYAEVSVLMVANGNIQVIVRDVTERKKAEKKLIHLNDRLEYAENQAKIGSWEWDIVSNKRYWSKNTFRLFGLEPASESPDLETYLECIHKEDREQIRQRMARIVLGERDIPNHEFRTNPSMGPVRNLFTSLYSECDNNGTIIKYSGVVLDITMHKNAEKVIKESEEKYRNLIEYANDAILLYSADGTIHEFNKTSYMLLGYSREEFRNLSINDILVDKIIMNPEKHAKLLAGKALTIYRQSKRKDGGLLDMEVSVKMQSDGKFIAFARDITERKRAEKELIEINTRLEHAEKQANIGSWGWCLQTQKSYWSKNLFLQLGLEPSPNPPELKVFLECIHPDDRSEIAKRQELITMGQEDLPNFEYRTNPEKGPVRTLYSTPHSHRDENGKIIKFSGTLLDITQTKIAEAKIIESKKRFQNLVENISGVYWINDLDNRKIMYVSPSYEILTGKKVEDFYQNNMDFISSIHPEDLEYYTEAYKNIRKNLKTEITYRLIDHSGQVNWISAKSRVLLDENGKKIEYGYAEIITEKKEAEIQMVNAIERYEFLSRATTDTIWDWDIVNNKMIYNEGIINVFGYKPSEDFNVVGWWNEKIHPDDLPQVTESMNNFIANRVQKFKLNYRFRCADGSYKHIFDRAFQILDENGHPIRIIGSMQDNTHHVMEEARISKAIIDAQEDERLFIGQELHDNINQILTGSLLALGLAEMAKDDIVKRSKFIESARGYIGNAVDEIRKLSHQLVPANTENDSLKDIIESLLISINPDNRFNISLDYQESTLPSIPYATQINLYRILQEQSKNILKYAEASSIEVSIIVSENWVKMRIFDNGKGFDTRTLKKGIGLTNIKKRAESQQGHFFLNSAPGKGCEIKVEIPINIGEES